jgi:FixJ family two-component response regulator
LVATGEARTLTLPHAGGPNVRLIAIIDDGEAMQDSLRDLMEAAELVARSLGSAEEFLESDSHTGLRILIVDIRMPKMSGLHELG